ncbi:MAG: hypothetical protein ACTSPW_14965, partial [Promethearchaeota archaeon]
EKKCKKIMIDKTKIIDEIEFFEATKMSLRKFYKDLHDAMDTNNTESIWQLSKIITRYAFRK